MAVSCIRFKLRLPVSTARTGGFAHPGSWMGFLALYHGDEGITDRNQINDALAGNLCRCTGYRPIVEAALEIRNGAADRFSRTDAEGLQALAALEDKADLIVGDDNSFFAAPSSEPSLARLFARHPDATI